MTVTIGELALESKVRELDRRISALENVAIGQAPQRPHGCICPATSEQTCKGWDCPRRDPTTIPRIGAV